MNSPQMATFGSAEEMFDTLYPKKDCEFRSKGTVTIPLEDYERMKEEAYRGVSCARAQQEALDLLRIACRFMYWDSKEGKWSISRFEVLREPGWKHAADLLNKIGGLKR